MSFLWTADILNPPIKTVSCLTLICFDTKDYAYAVTAVVVVTAVSIEVAAILC